MLPPMAEPERVIFLQAFESLQRALGERLDPALRGRFKAELGVDFGHLNPAYPLEAWNRGVRLAMQVLFPGDPRAERLMGARIVQTFAETTIGGALFVMLRVMGPRRALVRLTRNLRTSNNYSETSTKELDPNTYEVWINQVELPHFDAGVLEAGLSNAGARDVKVDVVSTDAKGTTYRVGWS